MNSAENIPALSIGPLVIRRADRADAPGLLRLIVALAEFEKLTPPDAAAQARLIEDGFGARPRFESWLVYVEGVEEPVGYAFFFETYSSFLARPTLYLEDIFVLPDYRGRGIGSALLHRCIRLAHERGCGRMEWTCLDWNTKAQCVYEKLGARRLSEWHLYRLTRDGMEKFLGAD
ncbi:MAG: GNAT family N-acetyltransferase [Verrucomicrobia bacterium]|nr:MAG: GNAT family N-acetyltransferase [Verrucomicrobiota bacterium]